MALISLMVTSYLAVAGPQHLRAVCDVGRVALQDLVVVNSNTDYASYYAGVGSSRPDLLEACPNLVDSIPAGYPLADDKARSNANLSVPIKGVAVRNTAIYSVGVPKLNVDRESATVIISYYCTGLCGGQFLANYIKTGVGWKRIGRVKPLTLS